MNKYFLLLCSLIFLGCASPDSPVPNDNNALFPGSDIITTIHPAHDSIVDTENCEFTWDSIGETHVFLGIFTKSIDVSNNTIVNINDNIWAWHTGLGTGRDGDVFFNDGYDVLEGTIDTSHLPTPLTSGESYYWAVWAWNEKGLDIKYSSEENYFTVQLP